MGKKSVDKEKTDGVIPFRYRPEQEAGKQTSS